MHVCTFKKAWYAARVSLRLARMPTQARRSRRLHAMLAAAPGLFAHAFDSTPHTTLRKHRVLAKRNSDALNLSRRQGFEHDPQILYDLAMTKKPEEIETSP